MAILQGSLLSDLCSEGLAIGREVSLFTSRQVKLAAHRLWTLRADIAIGALLGVAAASYAIWRLGQFDNAALGIAWNSWFDADIPRIIDENLHRKSDFHYRTSVHPLFSLLVTLPMEVLAGLGMDPQSVVACFVGLGALLFTGLFFGAARLQGLTRLHALAATWLMLTTAAAIFWLPAPETFVFGAASILIPIIWLASPRGEHDAWSAPLQSALSLSITVTNWMAGIAAAIAGLGLRKGFRACVTGFLLVIMLTLVQQLIFPHSGKPFYFKEEAQYVHVAAEGNRFLSFADALWAPEPAARMSESSLSMFVNFAPAGRATLAWWVWLSGWVVLCVLAIEAAIEGRVPQRLAIVIPTLLVLQLVLHMVYGDAPFLYSMHFTLLVVLVAASSCLGKRRNVALVVMAVTGLIAGAHNLHMHDRATELFNAYGHRALEARAASE